MQGSPTHQFGETKFTQGAQADFADLSELPQSIQGRYEPGLPSQAGSQMNLKCVDGPRRLASTRALIKGSGKIQVVGQPVPGAHLIPDAAFRNQHDTVNQILDLQKHIDKTNAGINILDSIEKIQQLQQISLNQRELARNSTINNIHTPVPGLGPSNKIVLQKQPHEPMSKAKTRRKKRVVPTTTENQGTSMDNLENSSLEEFETMDNRIQPMSWSPLNKQVNQQNKTPHKFNKPENDPLIMNVLNLIDQTQGESPVHSRPLSNSIEQLKRGGFSPNKNFDNTNKLGAALKYKKYRYKNNNDTIDLNEQQRHNIEIPNEVNEEILEMKKKLKDIITNGQEVPHLERIRNQYASFQTYDINTPQRHQIGLFGVKLPDNQVQSQIYQAYSRAKKNDSTNLNLSKIQDTKNVFSARRATFGGFGNLDILSSNMKMKHSPSVSPRANDNRTLVPKPYNVLDKNQQNKKTSQFESDTFQEPHQDSSRLPNIRAGSLLQPQKNSHNPDKGQNSHLNNNEKSKKRNPLLLSDTNSKESKDLELFLQSLKNQGQTTQLTSNTAEGKQDQNENISQSNRWRRQLTNKRITKMKTRSPSAEQTEETGENEESIDPNYDGPIKLLDESTELALFQKPEALEILDPQLLQENVRRQIEQKQLEIKALQDKKQIVSMPMGPLSQQIQQNVQDLQIMIQEKNIEDNLRLGRESPNEPQQQIPKMVKIVNKKRSSTKTEKLNNLVGIYGQQQNIIKVLNQQLATKNIKSSYLNNHSELGEKRKLPTGKVSPLKKNKDFQSLNKPRNSLGLQKQREILQAQNMKLDNITLALLQGTPNKNEKRNSSLNQKDFEEPGLIVQHIPTEPEIIPENDKNQDLFEERMKKKYGNRFKPQPRQNVKIEMDTQTKENEETIDGRTHSPLSSHEKTTTSKEKLQTMVNKQETQNATVDMGTSVYKSPKDVKTTNLELKEPFHLKQLQNQLAQIGDELVEGIHDERKSNERVIIHVEVGGDLIHNETYSPKILSPMHSNLTNTLVHTPKKGVRQSYFDDMYQVNKMVRDQNIGGKNGVLNQDIQNPGISNHQNQRAYMKMKIKVPKQNSNNNSPRKVVSLLKDNRNDSHLEISKNFNNFGEYAEYVSPKMYDHQKIQQTVAKQNAQMQMQQVRPSAFNRSKGIGSQIVNESVLSNDESDMRKSPTQDLLGFTTQNRGSVFQNPAMLSNTENMKPQDSKKLTDLLKPPPKSLQPKVGRQEKPSVPVIKVTDPQISKSPKTLELDPSNLPAPKIIQRTPKQELPIERVAREKNQQEYLMNYYRNATESKNNFQLKSQALNSLQARSKTKLSEKMEPSIVLTRISPGGRRHEPNQLTDTQNYLKSKEENKPDENTNETIPNSQQLLNQIQPRNANSRHDFSVILNNPVDSRKHDSNSLSMQWQIESEQRPPLRKQITVISENSLEHAAMEFDQPWVAQTNQNNIDEWDDTGLYDQIIKKQNLKNAKKKEKSQAKAATSKNTTPIHVKGDRVTERLKSSKQIQFKGLPASPQHQQVQNSKGFPERNVNLGRSSLQQQPNIQMTSQAHNKKLIQDGSQAVLVGYSAIAQQEQPLNGTAQLPNKSRLGTPERNRKSPTLRKQGHLASPVGNAGQYFQNSPFRLESNTSINQGPISLKSVSPQVRSYQLKLPPHVLMKHQVQQPETEQRQPEPNETLGAQNQRFVDPAKSREETKMTVQYDDASGNEQSQYRYTQQQILTSKQIHLQNLDRIIDTNISTAKAERGKKGSLDTDFLINQTEDIDVWLDRRKIEVAQIAEKKRIAQMKQQQIIANMASQ